MAINKVVLEGRTLIDISDSTLTAEDLLEGLIAYNKAGERIIGIMARMVVDAEMSNTSENAVQNKVVKTYIDGLTGDLSTLNTTEKTDLVKALNELKTGVDAAGEPFRVKQWAGANLNVEIPCCTEDIVNTSIAKMVFKISGQEATDFQVVGMIAYEVKNASGQRLNCWPVCQFTGQNQTELSVRWMCSGTTRQIATSINAWVLLKHR